jgi:CelD/BcsL family acetyltransferase involved in cellulose biosynthesis
VDEAFDPLLREWEPLAASSRNLFATAEWVKLWWDSFGGSARLRLVGARSPDGALVGVVPLSIARIGPLRVARFLGSGMGDLLGPVHAPGRDGPSLLEAALREIVGEWDIFLGERLPGGGAWSGAMETSELRRESNPVLRLSRWPDWDGYLRALSRRLRQDLRHDERQLSEHHRIRFRLTTDPARLSGDLDTVFALHRARWGEDRSSFVPREAFYRRFAEVALERGWLRLWILEADDHPVAARYDFELAGVYHAYNGGRDPSWSKAGVGLVLRAHTMREAMARGVEEYRFLRGGEPYKKRFLTEDAGLVTIAQGRTWLGRCAARVGALVKDSSRLRRLAHQLAPGRQSRRPIE